MNTDNKTAIIALTKKAIVLAQKLKNQWEEWDVFVPEGQAKEGFLPIQGKLKTFMPSLWKQYDRIVCIMATGIVVRTIAPCIEDKYKDPAIVVLDERGNHVISLLSGHIGGANSLTRDIAHYLGTVPVITTATDVNEVAALDEIAKTLNAFVENERENVLLVNRLLVNEGRVGLYVERPYTVDTRGFIEVDALENADRGRLDVLVAITHRELPDVQGVKLIKVVPRKLVLGVGCKKGTDIQLLKQSFLDFCKENGMDYHAFWRMGSITLKKEEQGVAKLAEFLGIQTKFFEKEELQKVESNCIQSTFVASITGTKSVAEAAAYVLSKGNIIVPKTIYPGITFAIGMVKE